MGLAGKFISSNHGDHIDGPSQTTFLHRVNFRTILGGVLLCDFRLSKTDDHPFCAVEFRMVYRIMGT